MSLASSLPRHGFELTAGTSPAPEKASKPPSPGGAREGPASSPASQGGSASAPASRPADASDEPAPRDRKPVLKPFSEISLRLHVTKGEPREERRVLLLGNGKGMSIRLRYTVRPIEGQNRYHMTYTIFRGKEMLSEERSIQFSAENGKINLAFELDPWRENDLSSFRSIRIVTQK